MVLYSSRKRSIAELFRKVVVSITIALVLVLGVSQILLEYNNGMRELENYRETEKDKRKVAVRNEVNNAISFIQSKEKRIEQNLRNIIKDRVQGAHGIAHNLYDEYNDSQSDKEILQLILEALRPIRFFSGRGYYFAVNMEGTELLYPPFPEYEGKNLINLTDKKGQKVIQDELEVVRSREEGFVADYWPMPGYPDTMTFEKTSFVKHFEPLNFYLGAGEYIKNIETEVKEKVLEELAEVRYGDHGYLFITSIEGKAVLIRSDKYERGDDILEMEDVDGVKVILEQHQAAKNPEGGFVSYKWFEPAQNRNVENLSYVKLYDPWGWVVGAWINMDDLKKEVQLKKAEIYNSLYYRSALVVSVIVVLLFAIYFIALQLGKKISEGFMSFIKNLDVALRHNQQIPQTDYQFTELEEMHHSSNQIITDRNAAQEKLARNENELRTIFNYAPIMMAEISGDGNFIIYNKQLEKVLGYSANELKDIKSAISILFPQDNEREKALRRIIKSAGEFNQYHVKSRSGEKMIHYWASFRISEEKIVLFGYDVTDIKKTQQELEKRGAELQRLNATKDRFFSIIAHDIKNPLNAMLGFAGILKEDYDELDEKERKDIIINIVNSSETLDKLIRNLLEWSRSQMGRISFNPIKMDITALIGENVQLMKTHAQSKYIKVELDIPERIPEVKADKSMIDTVIRNLLSNAVKFTRLNGKIMISVRADKDDVHVSIIDNGIGMLDEDIKKLFDLGSKFKRTGTSNEKGTGLGLILVKEFIEKNNGDLNVSSTIERGSTFTFSLPVSDKIQG